jgi:hypothetical protein
MTDNASEPQIQGEETGGLDVAGAWPELGKGQTIGSKKKGEKESKVVDTVSTGVSSSAPPVDFATDASSSSADNNVVSGPNQIPDFDSAGSADVPMAKSTSGDASQIAMMAVPVTQLANHVPFSEEQQTLQNVHLQIMMANQRRFEAIQSATCLAQANAALLEAQMLEMQTKFLVAEAQEKFRLRFGNVPAPAVQQTSGADVPADVHEPTPAVQQTFSASASTSASVLACAASAADVPVHVPVLVPAPAKKKRWVEVESSDDEDVQLKPQGQVVLPPPRREIQQPQQAQQVVPEALRWGPRIQIVPQPASARPKPPQQRAVDQRQAAIDETEWPIWPVPDNHHEFGFVRVEPGDCAIANCRAPKANGFSVFGYEIRFCKMHSQKYGRLQCPGCEKRHCYANNPWTQENGVKQIYCSPDCAANDGFYCDTPKCTRMAVGPKTNERGMLLARYCERCRASDR